MRVALLTNFIAPYRVPLLEVLQARIGTLRSFLSTKMESDRNWAVEWGRLDVIVQRTITLRRPYRDELGFTRRLHIHIPWDTLPQLFRFRPEVVISQELGLRSLQAAIYRALRPRTRLLIWATLSEHSERNWGWSRRMLRHAILRRADGVLVNGESGARYIARFGVPDACILRINQPVDVAMFAAAPRLRPETATSRLMHVGVLTRRKGCDRFAHEAASWARDNPGKELELWWLGDGELRAELEAMEMPPNLVQRFCGAVPYAELPRWYAQADILAFPSLLDEWGLVVNEAMAAGVPVLGSRYAQAVEELVEDGVTGWVFDPLTPGAAAAALDRVLATQPEVIRAMRVAARERIAALTPQSAGERIEHGLRRLAEAGA